MNTKFKSNFVIDIDLNKESSLKKYVDNKVQIFRDSKGIDSFKYIEAKQQISAKDFTDYKKVDFDYFYLKVLKGIKKQENSTIDFPKKICITFDKRLCQQYDEKSDRRYEVLKVGGIEAMYFILFTMDEIYEFLDS